MYKSLCKYIDALHSGKPSEELWESFKLCYVYHKALGDFVEEGTNRFICAEIYILSGTGAGQTGYITSYNGTTKVATVQTAWGVIPDNTSVYRIVTQDSKNANTISWDVNVVANNGTDTLDVICTGQANKNIVWYCTLEGIEILLS